MMMKAEQSGVALVAILLVVVIATVLAVSMIREQQAAVEVTRNFLVRGQATQYALGGEELARQLLYEDFAASTDRDHLAENWADPEHHFEFEAGEVNLRITDLQGLFNLNSLAATNNRRDLARQRLINMLNALGEDPYQVDRLQDWLDADEIKRGMGAEDFDYLVLNPPYRAGNGLMADVSELLLTGLPRAAYLSLAPHVTTRPDTDGEININTASALVLQSLSPGLSADTAQRLMQSRGSQGGYESAEAFLQAPELAGLGVSADDLGVQSAFFEVRVIARYQSRFSYLTSVIHRSGVNGDMRVIHRDFSRRFRPVPETQQVGR